MDIVGWPGFPERRAESILVGVFLEKNSSGPDVPDQALLSFIQLTASFKGPDVNREMMHLIRKVKYAVSASD